MVKLTQCKDKATAKYRVSYTALYFVSYTALYIAIRKSRSDGVTRVVSCCGVLP